MNVMTTHESSFQSLRVMLEAAVPARAMIAVSAARDEDGQSALAFGLARAYADAGRRTVLMSLYDRAGESPHGGEDDLAAWGGAFRQATRVPKDVHALVEELRSQHDLVIAVAPPIARDAVALETCRLAHGVLLAVRLGRKITEDDERTVLQLQRIAANLLGVVAMHPETTKVRVQRDLAAATRRLEAPAS